MNLHFLTNNGMILRAGDLLSLEEEWELCLAAYFAQSPARP